jgi:uncharacterized protein YcfL
MSNHRKLLVFTFAPLLMAAECSTEQPVSASGVKQATVDVQTQSNGLTIEQINIAERITRDNRPGSIKHLYVISAYSGQILIYSTVAGKVTSSSKRMTPTTVTSSDRSDGCYDGGGVGFLVGDTRHCTEEMIQDDGTYGSSIPYLFWFDSKGVYHQHYPEGGQMIHITEQPLSVPRIILNMETQVVIPPTDTSKLSERQ